MARWYFGTRTRVQSQPGAKGHGMSMTEVEDQYRRQDGRCSLCGNTLVFEKAQIDHDHTCCDHGCRQCARGLLHQYCNSTLGQHEAGHGALSTTEQRYLRLQFTWHLYLTE